MLYGYLKQYHPADLFLLDTGSQARCPTHLLLNATRVKAIKARTLRTQLLSRQPMTSNVPAVPDASTIATYKQAPLPT